MNPAAGRGAAKQLFTEVEVELERHRLDYRLSISRSAADPPRLAREAAAAGRTVVAMGGDGLVGSVADALAGSGAAMGVIAAGVGNDFARSLGIPVRDPPEAVRLLARGSARTIDLGRVTWDGGSRHFCTVAGTGLDSEATRWANGVSWLSGRPLYTVAALRTLARFSPVHFRLFADGDDPVVYPGWLVTAGNSTSYGGGMRITPRALVDDGLLDLTVIGPLGRLEFLREFSKVFAGRHLSNPRVEALTAAHVRVEADRPLDCYADGELCGPLPVEVEAVPGALRIIT